MLQASLPGMVQPTMDPPNYTPDTSELYGLIDELAGAQQRG